MTNDTTPWYKQFWLWFILTPLFIVFAVGFSMLYLAIVTDDGVVVDNFYKDGKGIIVRHEEDQFARDHKLQATINWEANTLSLNLIGQLTPLPETLELLIVYPTAKAYDVTVILAHRGLGEYQGALTEPVEGLRELQLQPINAQQSWRLHAKLTLPPPATEIILLPKPE